MMRPRNDAVLISYLPEKEKEGSIYLPKDIRATFKLAKVVAVGPGIILDSGVYAGCGDLGVGDIVLVKSADAGRARSAMGEVNTMVPTTVEFGKEGEKVHIIAQQNIVGIVEPEITI